MANVGLPSSSPSSSSSAAPSSSSLFLRPPWRPLPSRARGASTSGHPFHRRAAAQCHRAAGWAAGHPRGPSGLLSPAGSTARRAGWDVSCWPLRTFVVVDQDLTSRIPFDSRKGVVSQGLHKVSFRLLIRHKADMGAQLVEDVLAPVLLVFLRQSIEARRGRRRVHWLQGLRFRNRLWCLFGRSSQRSWASFFTRFALHALELSLGTVVCQDICGTMARLDRIPVAVVKLRAGGTGHPRTDSHAPGLQQARPSQPVLRCRRAAHSAHAQTRGL